MRERERETVTVTALLYCCALYRPTKRLQPPLLENFESTSTFRRFRKAVDKATIGLAIPVRPTVHIPAQNSAPPTGRNFVKFHLRFLMEYVHTF